ncbi:DUF7537 family lipoprotein [Haloglomus halophilum]|uniref:DUF7537 family lipoprotein n=1 Tax=Haloglomus halophilum TaxID=2962672 RepID=UPI0020C9CA2F|nr:hypothetical protein [Haloglomus halophilum]
MHRRRLVVALLALLLLAGCNALSAPSSGTETLTPAAVPEGVPTAAPGVPAAEGVTALDADRLLAADERRREATSYRLMRAVEIRGRNWTTRIDRDRRVAADGTIYERVETEGSPGLTPAVARSELWKDGSTVFVRTYDQDGTRIERGPFPSVPGHFRRWVLLREQLVTGGEYRVERTAEGVVLRTAEPPPVGEAVIPISLGEPRNVTAQLAVEESGLIRSLRLRYDTTFQGETVRVEITHRLTAVGNTTVDRPDWVD